MGLWRSWWTYFLSFPQVLKKFWFRNLISQFTSSHRIPFSGSYKFVYYSYQISNISCCKVIYAYIQDKHMFYSIHLIYNLAENHFHRQWTGIGFRFLLWISILGICLFFIAATTNLWKLSCEGILKSKFIIWYIITFKGCLLSRS